MDSSLLFNRSNYKSKIISMTNLRFLAFLIWKFLSLFLIIFLVYLILRLPIISHFDTFSFSLYTILKLFILTIASDYFLMYLFINTTFQLSIFERIVTWFTRPNKGTVVFSLLIVLNYFSWQTLNDCSSNLSDSKISFIYYIYSALLSVQLIGDIELNKYPSVHLPRMQAFVYILKTRKYLTFACKPRDKIICVFLYLLFTTNNSIWKTYSIFLIFTALDCLCFISFSMWKVFITAPINYYNKEMQNPAQFIQRNLCIEEYISFIQVHYLSTINQLILTALANPSESTNITIISMTSFISIREKIDPIYKSILHKIQRNPQNRMGRESVFSKYLNFSKNEIFERDTSLHIISIVIDIIFNYILLLLQVDINDKTTFEKYRMNITQLFLVIVYYDDILRNVWNKESFFNNMVNSDVVKGEIWNVRNAIESKINSLLTINAKVDFWTGALSNEIGRRVEMFRI